VVQEARTFERRDRRGFARGERRKAGMDETINNMVTDSIRQFRQAEMEVKKGQNMLEHETEIYSRPARTWFQSGKDKQQSEGVSY
jgi:ATP-dependent RNA helicase DDX27